jgi:large subunit ribosomal protein L14
VIQTQTVLDVADNTGAKKAMCIRVLGSTGRRYASIGDIIVLAIKKATPGCKEDFRPGKVAKGIVVRTKKTVKRADGTSIRFDSNAVVLIDAEGNPKGTRIFGAVAREIRSTSSLKIVSLAPEVI